MRNDVEVVHVAISYGTQYLVEGRAKIRIAHPWLTVGEYTRDPSAGREMEKRSREHRERTPEAVTGKENARSVSGSHFCHRLRQWRNNLPQRIGKAAVNASRNAFRQRTLVVIDIRKPIVRLDRLGPAKRDDDHGVSSGDEGLSR